MRNKCLYFYEYSKPECCTFTFLLNPIFISKLILPYDWGLADINLAGDINLIEDMWRYFLISGAQQKNYEYKSTNTPTYVMRKCTWDSDSGKHKWHLEYGNDVQ